MYKILFSDNCNTVCIADVLKVEDAVQFALNLHRSSNVKHCIVVRYEDDKSEEKHTVVLLESK